MAVEFRSEPDDLRQVQQALQQSEIGRRALLDRALDCIICADEQVRIIDFNPAAERTFHVPRSEALGKDLVERIFSPAIREALRFDLFARPVSGNVEVIGNRIETRCSRANGSEFPAEITVTQLIVGKRTSYVVYVRDITARRVAEEELIRLAAIVESSRDGIIGKDLKGRITSWNKGAEVIYGYSAREAIGHDVLILVPDDRAHEVAWIMDEVKEGRSIAGFETVSKTRAGKTLNVSLTVSPVFGSDGQIVGASTIARDITTQKLTEEALRKANETSIYASPLPIVAADTERRVTMWNHAAEALLGWSESEVIGKTNPSICGESLPEALGLHARVLSGQVLNGVDVRRQKRDGSLLDVNLCAAPIRDASGRIKGILGFLTDVTEQKRDQEALAKAEQKYRAIFENAVDGIYQSTPSGQYLSANPALAHMFGFDSPEELIRSRTDILTQEYVNPDVRGEFARALEKQDVVENFEYQAYRKDGTIIWVSGNAHIVRDSNGQVLYFEGTVQDVTHRHELEQQLQQMQRIEGVGRLAGGVAHDFNNILMAISSYAELLGKKLTDEKTQRYVQEIIKATDRGSSLTQGLLTFSREQVVSPKVLDLNKMISDQIKMLQRLIPENIELGFIPNTDIGAIKADPTQIEQVVMNLVINARDAMPEGGRLVIETGTAKLDGVDNILPGSPVGDYVMVAVSDNGCGMSAETKSRMFEPFYTTKEQGKGTGLGLSIVFGIIKQNAGQISVHSEVGVGTNIKVYFPMTESAFELQNGEAQEVQVSGSETILLVEDENSVRQSAVEYLRENGYTVLAASGGPEALQVAEQYNGTIHLLLTDLIMPQMSGRELSERITTTHPHIRVVFMSGYSNHMLSNQQVLDPKHVLLQKPFRLESLGKTIRETLSCSKKSSAAN